MKFKNPFCMNNLILKNLFIDTKNKTAIIFMITVHQYSYFFSGLAFGFTAFIEASFDKFQVVTTPLLGVKLQAYLNLIKILTASI